MSNFSVILGNVGQCSDRYMMGGYGRPFELEELFGRVASIGVKAVEYVGNWHISDKTLDRVLRLSKQYGLRAVAIIPDHFGTPVWGRGAFTSPDANVRQMAVQETLHMAELAKAIDCPLISIWNGQDGYDYPLQANYSDADKWLTDGITQCCEEAPDIKFSLEYKPKEPRNHSFLSNVWRALTLISESGVPNLGVTIDVGHSFEAYEDVAEAAAASMKRGKLFHLHMNDNWKFWDDDMIAGSIHTIEYLELFWWLKYLGYKGFISTDQYPYREDGKCAVEQTIRWMQAFERAAARIDDNRMLRLLAENDAVGSTAYMREILFGC